MKGDGSLNINRNSFYSWKKRVKSSTNITINIINNIALFIEYHLKYPSHGYRWPNAKIKLNKGIVMPDPYTYKCCKIADIKSKSKYYKYKKAGIPNSVFPDLLMTEMQIDKDLR